MKHKIIPILGILLGFCGVLHAGAIKETGVLPTIDDGGNSWRVRTTSASTSVVLISTRASAATYGTNGAAVGFWRNRTIVNLSTNATLILLPDPANYSVACTSCGIAVSSATAGSAPSPNSRYVFPGQGDIYAQWDTGGWGMGLEINEFFEK